jgi:hypothetical protein
MPTQQQRTTRAEALAVRRACSREMPDVDHQIAERACVPCSSSRKQRDSCPSLFGLHTALINCS